MKKILFSLILLLFIQLCIQADEIDWQDDITSAFKASKKQKKYMMIDVYTDWCTWCKELDNKTYTHDSVIKLSKQLINVKINPEKDETGKDFIKPYKIDGYPAILFIDWEKNLIGKINGFMEGEAFAKKVENILSFPDQHITYKKEHEKGNIKGSEALIDLYLEQEMEDDALAVIEELRLAQKLPQKSKYYFHIGFVYLSKEYYNTALLLFDYLLSNFPPTDDLEETDIYYRSAYYKGYALSSLGRIDECTTLVNTYKKDKNNPYAQYFEALIAE